ncbi:hypothetical protein DPMN_116354 [Dreissena polymorpha]|uniref:Uncharacterized protein n=1 Tax=Dreissena polymorpha TaxID=45954 RepID=A0A9D4QUN6_DREPO|nr:hypothetical protein DPMN_116354 [Dreissena polymorpha]
MTFSVLRRIKTYLRSSESQTRLNNFMTLHVQMQRTDVLDFTKIAEDFVARGDGAAVYFKKFKGVTARRVT